MYALWNDLRLAYETRGVETSPEYGELLRPYTEEVLAYNTPLMKGITDTLLGSPAMIAFNLLQNAIDEAKGGARVRLIAERHAAGGLRTRMLEHADDELRHSRQFLGLIKLTGIGTTEDSEGASVEADDVLNFDDDLRLFLCRVHSIEIRSWTMLRHYIASLADSPLQVRAAVPVLERIMQDEIRHVVYTGQQVSNWVHEDPLLAGSASECLRHTNRETWQDLAAMTRYLADNHVTALPQALFDKEGEAA